MVEQKVVIKHGCISLALHVNKVKSTLRQCARGFSMDSSFSSIGLPNCLDYHHRHHRASASASATALQHHQHPLISLSNGRTPRRWINRSNRRAQFQQYLPVELLHEPTIITSDRQTCQCRQAVFYSHARFRRLHEHKLIELSRPRPFLWARRRLRQTTEPKKTHAQLTYNI